MVSGGRWVFASLVLAILMDVRAQTSESLNPCFLCKIGQKMLKCDDGVIVRPIRNRRWDVGPNIVDVKIKFPKGAANRTMAGRCYLFVDEENVCCTFRQNGRAAGLPECSESTSCPCTCEFGMLGNETQNRRVRNRGEKRVTIPSASLRRTDELHCEDNKVFIERHSIKNFTLIVVSHKPNELDFELHVTRHFTSCNQSVGFEENDSMKWQLRGPEDRTSIELDLPSGDYCARVRGGPTSCVFFLPFKKDALYVAGTVSRPSDGHSALFIGCLSSLVAVLIFVIAGICLYKRRSVPRPDEERHLYCDPSSLHRRKVFLLHLPDGERMADTIDAFAKLLVNYFRCSEVSCLDLPDVEELMTNRQRFISKKKSEYDNIVILHTEASFFAYRDHENELRDAVPTMFEALFVDFVDDLLHDADKRYDYDRVVNIRFAFTEERYVVRKIVPRMHYALPDYLTEFYAKLHRVANADAEQHLLSMYGSETYENFIRIVEQRRLQLSVRDEQTRIIVS